MTSIQPSSNTHAAATQGGLPLPRSVTDEEPRGRGRPPLETLPRWSAHAVDDPSAPDDWQLSVFAPWPDEAYFARYVRKNLAASLAASMPEAWRLYPKSKSAKACRGSTNNGRRGRIDERWNPRCGTWSCEMCAIQNVIPHLCFAHLLMAAHSQIFVVVVPVATVKRDTFRKAVNRSSDFDFEVCALADEDGFVTTCHAVGVRVERNGFAFMYMTGEPTGLLRGLGEWFDTIDAFEHYRTVALVLPGIERQPTYYGMSGPTPTLGQPSGITMQAPALKPDTQEWYLRLRDELAHTRYNLPYADVLALTPLLTDDLCTEALRRAKARTVLP